MSLYDEAAKAIFKSHRPPYTSLIVDVAEYEEWLTLRMYRDNFEKHTREQKQVIALWVNEVMAEMRSVVPTYLEVFAHVPKSVPNQRKSDG